MKVEYVNHMGNDLAVVNAARVSFDKVSEELIDKDVRLINYLANHGHWTPFGHCSVSLRIKAPIFVARQLGKHQVGLVWNEVSRRYVDSLPEFYIPDTWNGRPSGSIKQGSDPSKPVDRLPNGFPVRYQYSQILNGCLDLYAQMLEAGVAPEQARMVLPQSMYTEWIWSGSLMAFARVCNLRLDTHAQKETRDVVVQIADIIGPLFPVSWEALRRKD